MQYYFVDKKNDRFVLQDSDIHHILHVLRAKNGEKVVFNNEGSQYLVSLKISQKSVDYEIVSKLEDKRELNIETTLIVGLPRLEKFEWIIQKATELGVTKIVPYISKRSIIKLDDKRQISKVERWQAIAKEAAEQSRRCAIPKIENVIYQKDLKNYLSKTNLLAYEESKEYTLLDKITNAKESITLLVGPEGGFDKSEVDFFINLGFDSVSLGNRILRCETAAIFLASLVSVYHN